MDRFVMGSSICMETPSMTQDEVRAAAERLVQFHERFAPLFGKEQAQYHAYTYVKGLMVCPERKSIEPIALNVGDGQVSALQKIINIAPWGHDDVQNEIQEVFVEELVRTAAAVPWASWGSSTRAVSPRRAVTARAWIVSTTGGLARKTIARSGSSWWASHPAARRSWIISFICPSRGASRPRPARTVARRSISPRRSVSRPSPRSPRG